ncbi:glycosyltransferase [Candidatus Gracilibacteria bacterium]|nr:glycosyltransferase [Candidatus Gracilibacteria bacterium]
MIKDKRILYISPRYFFPANDGAKIVFYNTIKQLAKYNRLDYITNVSKEDFSIKFKETSKYFDNFLYEIKDVSKQSFKDLFISLLFKESYFYKKYHTKAFSKMIKERFSENIYDVVWLESAYCTVFAEEIKKIDPNVKIVSRSHNVEHLLLKRIASEEKNSLKKYLIEREAVFWEKFEMGPLKFVDKFFTITQNDKDYFLKLAPELASKTEVLLPGVDFEKYKFTSLTKEKNLVFIGAMNYFPNIQAVEWFKQNIFDEISLFDKKSIKNLASDRIIVEDGKNKDTDYFNKSRIFIVPLLSGSGLKLKVLNALAMGKPILSTKIGLEGISLTNNKNVFESDDPEVWKTIILQNIGKSETLENIARNGREFVEENFSWEKNMKDVNV